MPMLVAFEEMDMTDTREATCCSSSAPAPSKRALGEAGWSCSSALLTMDGATLVLLAMLELLVRSPARPPAEEKPEREPEAEAVFEEEEAEEELPSEGGARSRVRNGCPSATRCLLTRRAKPSRVRAERSSRSSTSAERASARSRPLGSSSMKDAYYRYTFKSCMNCQIQVHAIKEYNTADCRRKSESNRVRAHRQ